MGLLSWNPEIKPKRRREIYEDVAKLSQPGGSFYVMVALSSVIAAYGLVINSAAVVIGAMLVAPLMGPIFGIALALTSGSRRLLWTSIQSELFGILIAIGVAFVIGLVPLRMPPGPEWLARTQPTLFDLSIAVASGLAGAYALVDERVSPALPGVAVAVALIPPLATCGLSMALMRWDMAAGSMMLFVANFFAIQLASAVVFSLFGMLRVRRERRREPDETAKVGQFLRRFSLSIVGLAVVSFFLTRTLLGLIADERLSAQIEQVLNRQVETTAGARLSDFHFQRQDSGLRVTATVMTPRLFEPSQVEELEKTLDARIKPDVHLIIRSLISRDMDREGAVFMTEEERETEAEEQERMQVLQTASRLITEELTTVPGAELMDVHRDSPDGTPTVTAVIRSPQPIGPALVSAAQRQMRQELGRPLRLVVRTTLVHDADAEGFLHGEGERARRERLVSEARSGLGGWLAENAPDLVLSDVALEQSDGAERLMVAVLSPDALSEHEARNIKLAARRVTDTALEVVVRYRLGGELSPPEPVAEMTPE